MEMRISETDKTENEKWELLGNPKPQHIVNYTLTSEWIVDWYFYFTLFLYSACD